MPSIYAVFEVPAVVSPGLWRRVVGRNSPTIQRNLLLPSLAFKDKLCLLLA
jgi:hypothetical protein